MPVIQDKSNRVTMHWNLHKIRLSSNDESPAGRPDVLYFLPELNGKSSRGQYVNMDEIEEIQEMLNDHVNRFDARSADFAELASLIYGRRAAKYATHCS